MWSTKYKCKCDEAINYPPGSDTLMSVGLFLLSATAGIADQLSPRKEDEDERLVIGSAVDTGTAAVGVAVDITSSFCFLGFGSCWLPARKLPTTT